MNRPDDIAAELPTPRDDEPESLRSDIIDELADHLQSAFHCELHTQTSDPNPETAARRRVLRRFGNPSTIARRLWQDAMREKIMSQRIATVAAVVAAVACVGMVFFTWQSSAANRAMLQQSQQMNSQLLEQMQGLASALSEDRGEDNRPAEWNQLQVRCVADGEDGPPLEGVRVFLESASENTVGIPPTSLTTDANGLVDFGRVLYGQYNLRLTAPNDLRTQRQISVRPGQDTLETIVCPTGDGLAELQIAPELEGDAIPPEMHRDRVWYLVTLVRSDSSTNSQWRRPVSDPRNVEVIHCFCGPNGELIAVAEPERVATSPQEPIGLFGDVTQAVWTLPEDAARLQSLRVEPGYYSFGEGAVCIMGDPSGRTLHQILIPDMDSQQGRVGDDPTTVAWGRTNTLTFPVSTTTFAMLRRIDEAAPELEVAKLPVRAVTDNLLRTSEGSNSAGFGSRVALSLRSLNRRRSFGEEPAPPEFLLTGVEVIAHLLPSRQRWPPERDGPEELLVLLTPGEREFLDSLDRPFYAALMPPDAERTSLDPAVKTQLLEELGFDSAEAE